MRSYIRLDTDIGALRSGDSYKITDRRLPEGIFGDVIHCRDGTWRYDARAFRSPGYVLRLIADFMDTLDGQS